MPRTRRYRPRLPSPPESRLAVAGRFLREGVAHLFGGPDHVCFVLGLLLLGGTLKTLLKTVTAFTLAHSVTLTLAVTGVFVRRRRAWSSRSSRSRSSPSPPRICVRVRPATASPTCARGSRSGSASSTASASQALWRRSACRKSPWESRLPRSTVASSWGKPALFSLSHPPSAGSPNPARKSTASSWLAAPSPLAWQARSGSFSVFGSCHTFHFFLSPPAPLPLVPRSSDGRGELLLLTAGGPLKWGRHGFLGSLNGLVETGKQFARRCLKDFVVG